MVDLFLIFFSVGGELSAPVEPCLRFSAGPVSPVRFGTQGTKVLGPGFLLDSVVTRMSL